MREPKCSDCGGKPRRNRTLCGVCAGKRKANDQYNPRSHRITHNAPFCLECIASGGYHRVGCATLSKEAA